MKNLVLKEIRLLGPFNIFFLGLALGLGLLGTIVNKDSEATLIYIFASLIPIYILVIPRIHVTYKKQGTDYYSCTLFSTIG